MSVDSTTKRTLQIKAGSVKRLTKEESSYVEEAQDQQKRIQKFIDDESRDEHDVNKQREVLQDSLKMIPDCRKRLEASVDDLFTFLSGLSSDESIKQSEEYAAADQALREAQEKLQTPLPTV